MSKMASTPKAKNISPASSASDFEVLSNHSSASSSSWRVLNEKDDFEGNAASSSRHFFSSRKHTALVTLSPNLKRMGAEEYLDSSSLYDENYFLSDHSDDADEEDTYSNAVGSKNSVDAETEPLNPEKKHVEGDVAATKYEFVTYKAVDDAIALCTEHVVKTDSKEDCNGGIDNKVYAPASGKADSQKDIDKGSIQPLKKTEDLPVEQSKVKAQAICESSDVKDKGGMVLQPSEIQTQQASIESNIKEQHTKQKKKEENLDEIAIDMSAATVEKPVETATTVEVKEQKKKKRRSGARVVQIAGEPEDEYGEEYWKLTDERTGDVYKMILFEKGKSAKEVLPSLEKPKEVDVWHLKDPQTGQKLYFDLCTTGIELGDYSIDFRGKPPKHLEHLEDIVCGICRKIMIDPYILLCSHSFCHYCIYEHRFVKTNDASCPVCHEISPTMQRADHLQQTVDKFVVEQKWYKKKSHRQMFERIKNYRRTWVTDHEKLQWRIAFLAVVLILGYFYIYLHIDTLEQDDYTKYEKDYFKRERKMNSKIFQSWMTALFLISFVMFLGQAFIVVLGSA